MEPRAALEQALTATEAIVREVSPDVMRRDTPCSEWDVRALLNHLVGDLWILEGSLTGKPPRFAPKIGGLPDRDVVGDDATTPYKEAADAVRTAATKNGALERAAMMAGAITTDIVVHGWDIAKATGQRVSFDEDIAEYLLGFVRKGISEQNRGSAFGAPVSVEASAPAIDQLVGFLGRDPRA